jgi:hypothetical protein
MNRNTLARLIVLIIPVLILIPVLGDFIYPKGSLYSDLSITHYPNAIFLAQALAAGKAIPLWSPAILSGYPFAADPLSGLWYPPGWFTFLFALPLGFNLTVILHLIWGGFGGYVLLRAQGLKITSSLVGAIIFEAFPKLFAHFAAGHITLVYAVCWTPWLLVAEMKWKQSLVAKHYWASPGIILGVIALADLRWAAFAGLIWLGYVLFEEKGSFKLVLLNLGMAALISAPVLLPLLQYSQLATRSMMTPAENFTLSLPPAKLLGLFYPNIGGDAEWVVYPGILTLILTLTLFFSPELIKRCRFWLFVTLAALIYSLGSNIPLLSNLALLPGFDLLRVPSRALFLTGLAFAVLAANCVDYLSGNEQIVFARIKPDLFLVSLAMFVVILAAGVIMLTGSFSIGFVWGAIGIVLATLLVLVRLHNKIHNAYFGYAVIVFTLIDLGTVNYLSIQVRTPVSVLSEGSGAAAYLSNLDTGIFRVYSPSYSIPQQTAAIYNLQLADGIDPLQLSAYVNFMEKADGVPSAGYSVTLPPFATGDPQKDNQLFIPDARLLGLLNIKYIAAAYDLLADGLTLVARVGETRIYENEFALPRAWIQPPGSEVGSNIQPVTIDRYSPNEVDISAQGPGQLVLSEVVYPGWQVWIDGKPGQMMTVAGVLRGVDLLAGNHQIKFIFRPWAVYAGIAGNLLTWAVILGAAFIARQNQKMRK